MTASHRPGSVQSLVLGAIRFYRRFMPALTGIFTVQTHCRFIPTCSHYAEEAVRSQGLLKGGALSLKRIARCHPWAAQKLDPVHSGVHHG